MAGDPFRTRRRFLNLVGFGFDVAVIDAARHARFLRGELLYKVTALQQLFRFPGFDVEVEERDGSLHGGRQLMLTVSNGCYFGGGFPIAPGASVDDGLLHACMIGDARPFERFRLFNLAETGRHVGSPRVELVGSASFSVRAAAPLRFEIDGDVYRSEGDEVRVEVTPGALEVVAAPRGVASGHGGPGGRAG
jgi:diacylglycerol kinase (ATP)